MARNPSSSTLLPEAFRINVGQPHNRIGMVPRCLRQQNEDDYTPRHISIGPLHHGKPHLAKMEMTKVQFSNEFCHRTTCAKLEAMKEFVEENEDDIRTCYIEKSSLKSPEYTKMVFNDVVFILEMFLKDHQEGGDVDLDRKRWRNGILRDLQLLENQLPYFVMEKLYDIAFSDLQDSGYPPFFNLSCSFFRESMSCKQARGIIFTDMIRFAFLGNHQEVESRGSITDITRTAASLEQSGVNLKPIDGVDTLDIKFRRTRGQLKWFENFELPWLEEGELLFSQLKVDDTTETLFHNMMALEQCWYPSETHICSHAFVISSLVYSADDLEVLRENKIISSTLTRDKLLEVLKGLYCQGIIRSDSRYYVHLENLRAYYRSPWTGTKVDLKKDFCKTLPKAIATTAALLALIFAFFSCLDLCNCYIQKP